MSLLKYSANIYFYGAYNICTFIVSIKACFGSVYIVMLYVYVSLCSVVSSVLFVCIKLTVRLLYTSPFSSIFCLPPHYFVLKLPPRRIYLPSLKWCDADTTNSSPNSPVFTGERCLPANHLDIKSSAMASHSTITYFLLFWRSCFSLTQQQTVTIFMDIRMDESTTCADYK